MPHAIRHSSALLPTLLLALAVGSPCVHAHGDKPHAPLAASANAGNAVDLVGRADNLIVVDHTTGVTRAYPFLRLADGRRFRLENAGSPSPESWIAVSGRLDHHTLHAASVRAVAAPPTPRNMPGRVLLVGTLRVFHIDYPDGTAEFGYTLFGDGGRRNVIDYGMPPPGVANGARVAASGPVDASGFVDVDTLEVFGAPAVAPQPKAAAALGTVNYTVIPLKYPNNTTTPYTYNADPGSWSIANITSTIFGAAPAASVAEYYKEVSFGAQLVGGVVANSANAWLEANAPRPAACSSNADLNNVLNSIESNGQAAASAAGFDPDAFPGQHYVIDALPCGWAGLGYIGFPLAYSKGTASLLVVGHEWGHNFGLYHAGSVDCGASVLNASGCGVTEYGDPFVIMGNRRAGHLNAFQKNRLGYIPGGVVTHDSGTATYTLGPIELAGQSQYAVRIPTGSTSRTYWIEFRQPIGFDAPVPGTEALGAQIRVSRPFENNCGGCTGYYDDTQILDMTPGTGTFTDAALLASQSYTDSTHDITINVLSASSSAMSVQVIKGAAGTAAITTLVSSSNPSVSGNSVTFTAAVTGSAPTGNVAFTANGAGIAGCSAVALTGSGNVRIAACATSALAVGTHAIVAAYAGNASNNASTSKPLSQVVNGTAPTTTSTTLASSANPSIAGNSVTFTATVTAGAPTGNVAFTANGSGIAGCSAVALTGNGSSRTAACSTSALAVGTHAIVAAYAGNAGNNASTSTPLSQVVRSASLAPTKTTLTSASNTSTEGPPVALVATVTATPPVSGGSVSFTANGAPVAGCTGVAIVAQGATRRATCKKALPVGAYSVIASYSGDAASAPSKSLVLSQVIPAAGIGNTLQFASASYGIGENGSGSITLTVTRRGDVSNAASVSYATASGSATAGADFASTFGQLQWLAHDGTSRNIVVPILDDGLVEGAEAFTVTLSLAQGASLGPVASTSVSILDDESAVATALGSATVSQQPYGSLTVLGATRNGNTISAWQKDVVIELGTASGTPGLYAQIDFQRLSVAPGTRLTIRSGAVGQVVRLVNAGTLAATIGGVLRVEGGNGAPPPTLVVLSASGLEIGASGEIVAPAGATLDTMVPGGMTGAPLVNHGRVDAGTALVVSAATVNGGGPWRANAITFATPGNLNNPVNGAHYLSNGLQLYPASGNNVTVTLAGFGVAPQFMNLMVHGNARLAMPSAWPGGSTLPANNRPVMPNETRPPGAPAPGYGGGSMIVQARGNLTLDGGASGDFVFPGGLAFLAGGVFDFNGVGVDNGWTQSGTPLQGVFVEAPAIVDNSPAPAIAVRTSHLNWVNFSSRPTRPVKTFTLQQVPAGAQFVAADAASPHFNFYSISVEASAAGQCWTCLMNPQVIDFSMAP